MVSKEIAKFEYDEEGLRTKKIVRTKTYEVYYDGKNNNLALKATKENNQVQRYRYYQWDENGKAVGMVIKDKNQSGNWQTKTYYFWTNQRGDVTTIVDKTGAELGSYTYDAYGNVLSETGTIAKENPIRYASYYYDQETKHYYLKARYYDPQNGNFLALDPHPGDDDDPVSQNGYTYANNNPVTTVDPDGNRGIVPVLLKVLKKSGKKGWKSVKKAWKKRKWTIQGPDKRSGRIFAIVNRRKKANKNTDSRLFALDNHQIRENKKRTKTKILHFHWKYKKNKHYFIYPTRKNVEWE
ncbi:RHS repeat-associated core domain-containing protein [Bacillus rubiinfantis]|uniref:RHS repeat-associated core domain-containing protein n=1 Tax=Bacillus rubiinfantis TaxID=1499680 RepID=UPI000A67B17A|nr:RHS repeat-associated core domain-containing protein [Bacillus rubiinfantis]